MQFSMHYFLLSMLFAIAFSVEYDCNDRNCFITINESNEKVFNCSTGEIQTDSIKCTFIKHYKKITLTTKDDAYIDIDKIAPGAFKRLTTGIEVTKFFMRKLRFSKIDSTDLDGLANISDMQLENPKSLDENTFFSLATTKMFFILTIFCSPEYKENSFKELFLKSSNWRFYSFNCYKQRTCEYSTCKLNKETVSKIVSSNITGTNNVQLSSNYCQKKKSCQVSEIKRKNTPKPKISPKAPTIQTVKSAKLNVIQTTNGDTYYDTLMWIVLILTGINSFVIMGILIFLIVWWSKLSSSATNKKHTIVLEDEDNSKYLKLSPYA